MVGIRDCSKETAQEAPLAKHLGDYARVRGSFAPPLTGKYKSGVGACNGTGGG
jgi:hypothetical protein